jgi:ketosteroid isomerase-like protein
MAIKKVKQLMEDLQNDTHVVLPGNVALADSATLATSAGNAGTASLATKATSAGYAGTANVAIHGTSGTSIIA